MSSQHTRKIAIRAALAGAGIFLVAILILVRNWPFTRTSVTKELEAASQSKVQFADFHASYFPRPGCVLGKVIFRHNPVAGSPPLMTVELLKIEGSFSGLFTKQVKRVRAEGLRILVPPRGTGEEFQTPKRSPFVIDELAADGAILQIGSKNPDHPPLNFSFHTFSLENVGGRGAATFHAMFSNPQPPGDITASGKFGPWNEDDIGKTALSGEYSFQHADLGVFHGIAGLLSSSGKFSGVLSHIEAEGLTDTPAFLVTSSSHPVHLETRFRAVVNGENGDTFLQNVDVTFLKTAIWSKGSVVHQSGQPGKTASIEFAARAGRIQDLLLLFTKSNRAPMSGVVDFHADVTLPPGKEEFLRKVELQGDFGVNAGSFTKSDTQEAVNHLSLGALGEKDRKDKNQFGSSESGGGEDNRNTVLSDLKGHVVLKDGMARLSNLSFSVPGALASMQGTYNLITEKVDLRGTLKTESEPSDSTSGMKAVMLKVLEPFFRKKKIGYELPVKITGTYGNPSFGLDVGDRNRNEARKQMTRATRLLGKTTH